MQWLQQMLKEALHSQMCELSWIVLLESQLNLVAKQ